jgi:small glutamine-rich tetratricopeptide repeat-containing protein alpha
VIGARPFPVLVLVGVCCALLTGSVRGSGPEEAQALFKQGVEASAKREWEAAIERYTRAVEANPRSLETYMERASMYQITDRVDQAIADYHRALELKPDHYPALERLATAYDKKGAYPKAVEYYGKALEQVSDPKWRSIIKTRLQQASDKMKSDR